MARFHFDLLNTTGFACDHDSVECDGRGQIEAHARDLLALGAMYHDGGMYPVRVTVLNDSLSLILTATAQAGETRMTWNWPTGP